MTMRQSLPASVEVHPVRLATEESWLSDSENDLLSYHIYCWAVKVTITQLSKLFVLNIKSNKIDDRKKI